MTLTSCDPRPVLTAAEMRAAEDRVIAAGTPARDLMERAGAAAAATILAFDAPASAIVLCGPGNNGGDGYVVARHLAAAGVKVVVAADAPPAADPARAAAADWTGAVVPLGDAPAAACMVDALFGTGLSRPLGTDHVAALTRGAAARLCVALDLPSGVGSDDGNDLGCPYEARLTMAFGALKPAHLLHPAAARCGRVVIADIGVPAASTLVRNARPARLRLSATAHKYARGFVLVVGGPAGHGGAARLAALAALRVGAGVVTLAVPTPAQTENAARLDAVMLRIADDGPALARLLGDRHLTVLLVGPGLGRDARARGLVETALADGRPLVLDGDVFTLFAAGAEGLQRRLRAPAVLTPHEGEFARLFPEARGNKVERARAAAARIGAVVALKGPDTVVAAPDGRASVNVHASANLATAGSGDVLSGLIAGLLAQGLDAYDAACAGVWLHGDLGRRGGPGMIADDLAGLIPAALASL